MEKNFDTGLTELLEKIDQLLERVVGLFCSPKVTIQEWIYKSFITWHYYTIRITSAADFFLIFRMKHINIEGEDIVKYLRSFLGRNGRCMDWHMKNY